MITATVEELIHCKDALEHLNTSPMPAKTAFRFSYAVHHMNHRLAELEQAIEEKREELDEGQEPGEDIDQILKEFVKEQLGQHVEVPGEPIELSELGPMVALTPAQAALLYWLIFEDTSEPNG